MPQISSYKLMLGVVADVIDLILSTVLGLVRGVGAVGDTGLGSLGGDGLADLRILAKDLFGAEG
jgi:hypothetical protein